MLITVLISFILLLYVWGAVQSFVLAHYIVNKYRNRTYSVLGIVFWFLPSPFIYLTRVKK